MKKITTSNRLKEIMRIHNLRQVDILEMTKPYCEKYNIKMNKSDISQYVSGSVEPGQEKLSVLGMALNVSEVWLMGYDVPMERDYIHGQDIGNPTPESMSLLNNFNKLNDLGKSEAIKRVRELSLIEKYTIENNKPYLLPNAAHEIEGSSDEDKAHDNALMDDDNF